MKKDKNTPMKKSFFWLKFQIWWYQFFGLRTGCTTFELMKELGKSESEAFRIHNHVEKLNNKK